jgi:hypothetical protein
MQRGAEAAAEAGEFTAEESVFVGKVEDVPGSEGEGV